MEGPALSRTPARAAKPWPRTHCRPNRKILHRRDAAMPYDVRDFERDVLDASHHIPVVADFGAEWCGPCRALAPVLEGMADEARGEWRLAKVDADAFPEVAAREGVKGLPNVKLYVNGAVVDEFFGALPKDQILQWIQRNLPNEQDGDASQT